MHANGNETVLLAFSANGMHRVGSWECVGLDTGGSGILSLAGNKISLNLRRQERNFRNPQDSGEFVISVRYCSTKYSVLQ